MKVRDLIAALQALDPELPVMMPSHLEADFASIDQVMLDVMSPSKYAGFELCDYEDEGCMTVVRLFENGEYDDRNERPKPPTS